MAGLPFRPDVGGPPSRLPVFVPGRVFGRRASPESVPEAPYGRVSDPEGPSRVPGGGQGASGHRADSVRRDLSRARSHAEDVSIRALARTSFTPPPRYAHLRRFYLIM